MNAQAPKFPIFISWSKSPSKGVANLLKGLLEEVLDSVEAFVSDVDIPVGSRSMELIHTRLNSARAGVLIITKANQFNPWINFEAGLLARRGTGEVNPIVPLLIDSVNATDVEGPLADLQNTVFSHDGLTDVVKVLAKSSGTNEITALTRFNRAWLETLQAFETIMEAHSGTTVAGRSDGSKLDEILERVRRLEPSAPPVFLPSEPVYTTVTLGDPPAV